MFIGIRAVMRYIALKGFSLEEVHEDMAVLEEGAPSAEGAWRRPPSYKFSHFLEVMNLSIYPTIPSDQWKLGIVPASKVSIANLSSECSAVVSM
ncbi:unnamed protein product [Pleuronectes platessa]|uniref:Uncharacterized protein n=1 Tax=Pleuronectes platessa TaxID=8262 RepID=A0A9N7TGK1_PLEPL|nr:unnamed protein product [Pleuronectes platessa]